MILVNNVSMTMLSHLIIPKFLARKGNVRSGIMNVSSISQDSPSPFF